MLVTALNPIEKGCKEMDQESMLGYFLDLLTDHFDLLPENWFWRNLRDRG
jgi:hypothetical protein